MMGADDLPLVVEVPWPNWTEALHLWAQLPFPLFFDTPESIAGKTALGRYSFLMADPVEFFLLPAQATAKQARDMFETMAERFRSLQRPKAEGPVPFPGGLAGFWGYELNRAFEDVPAARWDDCGWPLLAVGLYDVVLAADHVTQKAWLISQGLPYSGASGKTHARDRLAAFENLLRTGQVPAGALRRQQVPTGRQSLPDAGAVLTESSLSRHIPDLQNRQGELSSLQHQKPVFRSGMAESLALSSNFTSEEYIETVGRAIEYILAGDIFQVNLAQRLAVPAHGDSLTLYQRLRTVNPAPFAGYFDFGSGQLLSASPECFLRVEGRYVQTRPIKGTRPRTGVPEVDRQTAAELASARKDQAENIMITDLLRNDLSRVCEPQSVTVPALCRVEEYATVYHLVSIIEGQLAAGYDVFDLLAACFPGGSVTGAPKIRAMEIIAELEPHVRGPYCGSLGYISVSGNAQFNILIRTILGRNGWWLFSVGGGILARSRPLAEYEETWHKARALIQAIAEYKSTAVRD